MGSVVAGGTGAFFSDTETSAGNIFTAGSLDLTVDNTSYLNGVYRPDTSWSLADLDDGQGPSSADGKYFFFDFRDIKPSDWGEDTISLHVHDNPSWACMDLSLSAEDDNGITGPEAAAGDATDGPGVGELQNELTVAWWLDDGDNVLETNETAHEFQARLADEDGMSVPIADSSADSFLDGPLAPDTESHIAAAWCYGTLTLAPETQDELGHSTDGSGNGPDVRGSGIVCDMRGTSNITQTDSVMLTLSFRAEQARHNPDFVCGTGLPGGGEQPPVGTVFATSTRATTTDLGVSFRSFKNSTGNDAPNEVVLGPVPFTGGGHETKDLLWLTGTNTIRFVYATDTDTLTATVNGSSLVYGDVAAHASCPVADWSVLQLHIKQAGAASVLVHGLTIGSFTAPDLVGGTGPYWTVSGLALRDGFTAAADLVLGGTLDNGEGSKVDLSVGCGG